MRKPNTTLWIFLISLAAVLGVLAYHAITSMQSLWGGPEHLLKNYLLSLILWWSWLLIPMIAYAIWVLFAKAGRQRVVASLALIPILLLSYGRFVEPNLLVVERHQIPAPFTYKIALVGDVHVGLFSTERQLQHLVTKLNALAVDEVWVAGDWTYLPPLNMHKAFAALKDLNLPMYSVPGNHDAERPGPPLQNALRQVLTDYGVQHLENRVAEHDNFNLLGLGSAWAFQADFTLAAETNNGKPNIVLAHNPDVANFLPEPVFLTVAAHTHGGQVDLPWLTQRILSAITMAGVDEGWYETPAGTLFVTRGVGMVGLPVRFLNTPVIDVIEFSPEALAPALQDATAPKGAFLGR